MSRARRLRRAEFPSVSITPGISTSTARWPACRTRPRTRQPSTASAMGLKPVPRFENYKGMLFVNYDRDAEDLVSYLGNAREYLDYMLDFGGEDVEIVHGLAGLQHEGQLETAGRKQHRRLPRGPDPPPLFHAISHDIGVDTASWARAAPAVRHRPRAGRRPFRIENRTAADARSRHRRKTNWRDPRPAGREISAPSGRTASPTSTATCSSSPT